MRKTEQYFTGRAVHSSTSHTSREKASIEELISTQEPKTD